MAVHISTTFDRKDLLKVISTHNNIIIKRLAILFDVGLWYKIILKL